MAKTATTKVKARATKTTAKVSLGTLERVILYVSDFDRSVKFYTETLGIPLKYKEEGWAALATTGIELNLHSGRKSKTNEDEPTVSFRVDNFDATYAALKTAGVKVGKIGEPCAGLRYACLKDPDGNSLGIEGK